MFYKLNDNNKALLISHDSNNSILHNLLKNSINKIQIESNSIISKLTYEKLKIFKMVIYDLKDGGYGDTKNIDEIKNYLLNGGNIILTHDHIYGNYANLLGAKKDNKWLLKKKAKILKKTHPIFKSFYNLLLFVNDEFEISDTHKHALNFENLEEYNQKLLIELDDGMHGEYLYIKEFGKGRIILWNVGHSGNILNDFEKKLFINILHWICN